MNLSKSILCKIGTLLLLFCFFLLSASAKTGDHPVLIISSYNPDARQTARTISDFIEKYPRLGGQRTIALENMNCKSFSESARWSRRMKGLLAKYKGREKPSLIVLIGQEAWAAYLSLGDSIPKDIPVLSALASKNAIVLPQSTDSLQTWMPKSVDFFTDFSKPTIQSGFLYHYDVVANINLIKKLYPQTKNIAFISDNSYGGVSLQAHVIQEMKKFPELNLILLDGRVNTIYTITDKLHDLPSESAILLGTWRVDMNDGYFMRNATYAMMEAAPHVPAFSITSLALGHWAIGGVVPAYRPVGKEMAEQAVKMLSDPNNKKKSMKIISNETILDSKIIKEKNIDISDIEGPVNFVNESPSFFEQYQIQIWSFISVMIGLIIALLISLYFFYHTKKLKDELEDSEGALREAKDRAEESNRLKSAFVANMSHEIRTPLNAIVGFSDVLSAGECSEEEQRSYFEIIRRNSDLLLRLINDILDVSRLEANRVSLSLEKCDMVWFCPQILISVEQARKSDNQFLFQCEHDSIEIHADIQRLQQVLINLLSNADKFTKKGIITLKLYIDRSKQMVVFSVTDTGCGIPINKHKTVFERFEKLNEYAQGTGLGLSICKLTITKWGGDIWIDPTYTDGARFVFTHPMNL